MYAKTQTELAVLGYVADRVRKSGRSACAGAESWVTLSHHLHGQQTVHHNADRSHCRGCVSMCTAFCCIICYLVCSTLHCMCLLSTLGKYVLTTFKLYNMFAKLLPDSSLRDCDEVPLKRGVVMHLGHARAT